MTGGAYRKSSEVVFPETAKICSLPKFAQNTLVSISREGVNVEKIVIIITLLGSQNVRSKVLVDLGSQSKRGSKI